MTRAVVVSGCEHTRRVISAALCPACVLEPVLVGAVEPVPCVRCGGRGAVTKLSLGAMPCPACRPDARPPCPYCGGTGRTRGGAPCDAGWHHG